MYLQASIKELTTNPNFVINNLQHEPVMIIADDKPAFYCVNASEFLQFLAFKQNTMPLSEKQKKSIDAFAGMFKDKTNVQLTIDEINQAISEAGANAGISGLADE